MHLVLKGKKMGFQASISGSQEMCFPETIHLSKADYKTILV